MLFNTVQFFLFLPAVLLLFYAAPRAARKYILLAASYLFYAAWNPKFIALLLALTAIDYTAGLWIERVSPGRRKAALLMSLTANLGFLGFFKYYNFAAANLAWLVGRPQGSFWLDIVLPVGISFHTLQSMSYVIDVYRGQQRAVRNPLDYALYIAFFPQLVSGPIVRAHVFFRDLGAWRPPSPDDLARGIFLLVLGLAKKMAFADQFAPVVNSYFADPSHQPGMLNAWSAVFAFGLQVYFDFSGYTDMAIGMAQILGFHFPDNFRRPFLAASITELWRRWHISLSSWLRDYLYIPLGGNRGGTLKTYRNLMLTMLLGGLWHGASWNFVIWGGYHGVLLSVERLLGVGRQDTAVRSWSYPFRALLTFTLFLISQVFFRAADLPQSVALLRQMFAGHPGRLLLEPWHLLLAAASLAIALAEEHLGWSDRLMRAPALAYALALALILFTIEIFGFVGASIPFIYFQF